MVNINLELFDPLDREQYQEIIAPDAVILRGFANSEINTLLIDLQQLIQLAPFRHMTTPGGFIMSVAMSNCGLYGWVSDRTGYRYDPIDPLSGRKWPDMPYSFLTLASSAAKQAGFQDFKPDACLINCYEPKSRLSLHQDKNEKDFTQPIVSVSLGIPAVFLFGGFKRTEKTQRFQLEHGDVAVWGATSRLRYHGVMPLKEAYHPLVGNCRINLTFRKAF